MKKLLCILLALFMLCGVTACGNNRSPVEDESLRRIFSPVIKVSKSGVATWTDLEGAEKFVYKINGGKEVTTTERSVQLNLNDVIEVKCLGDNVKTRSSRWSRGQYIPRRSFVYNNGGTAGNAVNIYKPDGTIVLDTIGGTKEYGDVLLEGEDYVFEFDITSGPYHNALLLAGVENSVISDLTWSDTAYNLSSDSSKEDKSDKFYEVNHDSVYQMYGTPGYPGLHRYHWDGGYWGMTTYGWKTKSSPIINDEGIYDFTDDSIWTVEPNWCSCMYGAHFISSGKNTSVQMDAGYKFVRFNISFYRFNTLSTGEVDGVEDYGKLLGRENFNFFSLIHQNVSYLFFDSDKVREYEERNNSYVVDDNGEAATGVNI